MKYFACFLSLLLLCFDFPINYLIAAEETVPNTEHGEPNDNVDPMQIINVNEGHDDDPSNSYDPFHSITLSNGNFHEEEGQEQGNEEMQDDMFQALSSLGGFRLTNSFPSFPFAPQPMMSEGNSFSVRVIRFGAPPEYVDSECFNDAVTFCRRELHMEDEKLITICLIEYYDDLVPECQDVLSKKQIKFGKKTVNVKDLYENKDSDETTDEHMEKKAQKQALNEFLSAYASAKANQQPSKSETLLFLLKDIVFLLCIVAIIVFIVWKFKPSLFESDILNSKKGIRYHQAKQNID